MKLADLYPFVVPHVIDMPIPLVDLHIRKAATEFFRRTHAWQLDLDSFAFEEGKVSYDLGGPTGADVVKVLSVLANGDDYVKATKFVDGLTLVFDEHTSPQAAAQVTARVALTPRVGDITKGWSLPSELDQYAWDIAQGAIAYALATKPGGLQEASQYASEFRTRISTVGIKASREFASTRISKPSTVQHF